MKVVPQNKPTLIWEAFYPEGSWFTGEFILPSLEIKRASDQDFARRLVNILNITKQLNPRFLSETGFRVTTRLDFNPEYGFGSSSTFIVNLARWAKIDAFKLQKLTFKGSGYDIACGLEAKPIVYKLLHNKPTYYPVDFDPPFAENLYFVYLGQKRRSLEAIAAFKKNASFTSSQIDAITSITHKIMDTTSLTAFEELMNEHESVMETILQTAKTGSRIFPWYKDGVVKSLGAWGGDFVLFTSKKQPKEFREEMFKHDVKVLFQYKNLIL